MKQALIILILATVSAISVSAQKGLNVENVFSEKYATQPNAVATFISGDKVADYDLSLYRSLSLSCDTTTASEIEHLVLSDGTKATYKEVSYREGHLRYGFFVMPTQSGTSPNRYIFFVGKPTENDKSKTKIVVIYMQGSASTKQIKKMIQ